MPFDPNDLYFQMCQIIHDNKERTESIKIFNEGGTRSSKTWDTFHLIYTLCRNNQDKDLDIYILRETLVKSRDFTFKDFKKCMTVIGCRPIYTSEKSKPQVELYGNNIYFLGVESEDDSEGYPSDILFFNEMLEMDETEVSGLIMRCRKIVIGDWNPKFTKHWAFKKEGQPNTFFTRSTYLNNKHLQPSIIAGIKQYEPWEPGTYSVENGIIMFNGEPVADKNQPPPHPFNSFSEKGDPTANLFRWKVYGLGLRGAMTGLIHPYHKVIDKFPKDMAHIFANDFGFTNDPNALVKYAQEGKNIYLELLCYTPVETSGKLADYFDAIGMAKLTPITCDSADRFVSKDYGIQSMVKGLRERGYSASKVSKTKNVAFWIGEMNECIIHIVRNKFYNFAKTEAENYMWKKIHGIELNTPQDGNDHFWNAARYGYMSWNQKTKIWG